ncbi:hypothetical protein V6N12_017792 [Hibiscus sabdariffa]|uniref:Uncharacterized protein n=1 Tax=Hibiscus sabdariffa TaxID=183260 RepID=A0ABR2BBL2_9ROSI
MHRPRTTDQKSKTRINQLFTTAITDGSHPFKTSQSSQPPELCENPRRLSLPRKIDDRRNDQWGVYSGSGSQATNQFQRAKPENRLPGFMKKMWGKFWGRVRTTNV